MMNLYEVARFLEAHDNYDILTHAYPDGDTLGSGFALCLALRQIGKKARVITTGVPSKFTYLQKNIEASPSISSSPVLSFLSISSVV